MKRHSVFSIQHSGRLAALLLFLLMPAYGFARDAAFLEPGSSGSSEEAIKVDPKAEIDVGETVMGASKHATVFFVNQTNMPVKIEKVAINGDSNVSAEASADDCSKQGSIAPSSRCSIEVSITPSSPGTWSVDVLMTHNGAGRIARARLTGKTSGTASSDGKNSGLAVTSRDIKPIDFGDVIVGNGKTVRSTLMVNDSPEPITIYSIDVIEADNGLQRLDQGCAVDMELAPGASCPVTLLWVPQSSGPISTDLIIRNSGHLGFSVIPVRGLAKDSKDAKDNKDSKTADSKKDVVPLPPSQADLEKALSNHVAPVSSAALGGDAMSETAPAKKPASDGHLHLIGTIGERALFLKPDGETAVVPMGGEFEDGEHTAKLVAVNPHSADIVVSGKRRTLQLEAVGALVDRATKQAQEDAAAALNKGTSGGLPGNTPQSVALGARK